MLNYKKLEELYRKYNKREFVSPDPLQFLYEYPDPADREIVGLIAASLAYGRVAQILVSVKKILDPMGQSPKKFILENSEREFRNIFKDFKHRFTTGSHKVDLLLGIKTCIEEYGSLEKCFTSGYSEKDANIIPALEKFAKKLTRFYDTPTAYLFPAPSKGSACKRPMLFLRWMVRNDEVDPGGWHHIPASKLLIPLDTHMHKISRKSGLTKRNNADLKCVVEITEVFANINREDPVKYDFALTRFGIREDMKIEDLF